MLTQLGGVYKLQLQLFNTEQLTSSNWLIGALGINYRQADLLALDSYNPGNATVRIVWRRGGPGEIPVGDRVVPFLGDIDVSGQTTPYAVVSTIEELGVISELAKTIDYKLKLLAAAAMIATTAYFTMRIKANVRRAARV
jgi:hypothetical protein